MPSGKRRGGFCGHYAIVFTQCCQAMGIQARYVFASLPGVVAGHEVAEFWSDEYGKWILMDPNMDRYYLDRQTRIPMSAMEIHQAILRHYFQDSKIGHSSNNKARYDARGLESFLENGPIEVYGGHDAGVPGWFDARQSHLMWGHPRMMPGSDFLSRGHPMPKGHGYGMPWVLERLLQLVRRSDSPAGRLPELHRSAGGFLLEPEPGGPDAGTDARGGHPACDRRHLHPRSAVAPGFD
jgi:hypothetical protein